MVKQRFLTHFKPWLFAVGKVVGPVVAYQLINQARAFVRYAPLNVADVLVGAAVTLSMIGLLCGLWAWGEWCWFKLRSVRQFCRELKRVLKDHWRVETVRTSRPVTGSMR